MDPITLGLIIGGGLGFAKGQGDIESAREARKREAEIARWSPWTGLAPQRIDQPNVLGSAMQGALAGGQFGKQFGSSTPDITSKGSETALTESPNAPYLTEAEYAQKIQPMGLPPTTAEYGWLEQSGQYPLGYPTTQYPVPIEPMPPMQSPWPTIYGPSRS